MPVPLQLDRSVQPKAAMPGEVPRHGINKLPLSRAPILFTTLVVKQSRLYYMTKYTIQLSSECLGLYKLYLVRKY